MTIKLKTTVLLLLPIGLGGCVSTEYARRDAGFATVSDTVAVAATKQTVWIQNKQQAQAISDKVKDLVARKPLDVDTAVQVALLNNRGLQAAYANLGDGAADAWQSTMLINPTVALGLTGIGTPELEAWRAFEGMVAANILALATRKKNIEIADDRFRQAQLGAAVATLTLAADTRRAWINAVSALESVGQLQRAQAAADAASELAPSSARPARWARPHKLANTSSLPNWRLSRRGLALPPGWRRKNSLALWDFGARRRTTRYKTASRLSPRRWRSGTPSRPRRCKSASI
jgi:hypothetical protein